LNAEQHIKEVVQALQNCDEILVVDTGSTDRTIEIVSEFPKVRVEQIQFVGFGPTKQKAIELAAHDWILSVDADEIVSLNLVDQCKMLVHQNNERLLGRIQRRNYCLGKEIKHSGWGSDFLIRLFNRTHTSFDSAPVHESVIQKPDSTVVTLTAQIHHYPVDHIDQFFTKTILYSNLRNRSSSRVFSQSSLIYATVAALVRFLRTFIFKLGFLDGKHGFIISAANAQGVFWRYTKEVFRDERMPKKKES
jgi:glycosyltransferase involved in cell wall biosynthesis